MVVTLGNTKVNVLLNAADPPTQFVNFGSSQRHHKI